MPKEYLRRNRSRMIFSSPIWDPRKNIYTVDINDENNIYREESIYTSLDNHQQPDTDNDMFKGFLNNFITILILEGKHWFASPIKESIFLKKLKHTFYNYNKPNYSGNVQYSWTPYLLEVSPRSFDLYWKASIEEMNDTVIPINYLEFSNELTEPKALRTVIIQNESSPSEDQLIENDEIPFRASDIFDKSLEYEISSRAIIKKKVREARLKAAFATMKAERLAEKYFRRYGNQCDLDDNESELSFDSGGRNEE